jgi:hypothetical protein
MGCISKGGLKWHSEYTLLVMTSVTAPVALTSVKAAIESLIAEGILDNQTLLNKSGAGSIEYVRKVKSEYLSKIKFTKPKQQNDDAPDLHKATQHEYTPPVKLPSLSQEDRQKLWAEFEARTTLPQIIVKFGFPSAIVLDEFAYYERMAGISVPAMQAELLAYLGQSMDFFVSGPLRNHHEEYKTLVAEFKSKGQVGMPQFKKILLLVRKLAYQKGMLFVNDVDKSPPKNWARPLCKICGKPMTGIVCDKTIGWGNDVLEGRYHKRLVHHVCELTERR